MLGDDTAHDGIHFASHISSITAHVEVTLLLEQFVDLSRILLQPVLNVNLLWALTGKRSDELKVVAQILLVLLETRLA